MNGMIIALQTVLVSSSARNGIRAEMLRDMIAEERAEVGAGHNQNRQAFQGAGGSPLRRFPKSRDHPFLDLIAGLAESFQFGVAGFAHARRVHDRPVFDLKVVEPR